MKRGDRSPDEVRAVIDEMVDPGWYCSTDLYATIQRTPDDFA